MKGKRAKEVVDEGLKYRTERKELTEKIAIRNMRGPKICPHFWDT